MGSPRPKCPNCGCPGGSTCTILSDDFARSDSTDLGSDWSEDAGDWSIASGQLATSSAGALAITTASRSSVDNYVVQAEISSGASIILDYDGTNWHEIRYSQSDGLFRLFRVAAGSPTFVSLMGFVATKPATVSPTICVEGSLLLLNYLTLRTNATITPFGGLKAGIGQTSGSVTADNFLYSYHRLDDSGCPYCSTDCITCTEDNESLTEYIVDLSEFALTNLATPSNACNRCPDIAGEYSIRYTTSCGWFYGELAYCDNGCILYGSPNSLCATDASLGVGMSLVEVVEGCLLEVGVNLFGVISPDESEPCDCPILAIKYRKTQATPFDMLNLNETLTLDVGDSINEVCGGTLPSTITVRSP